MKLTKSFSGGGGKSERSDARTCFGGEGFLLAEFKVKGIHLSFLVLLLFVPCDLRILGAASELHSKAVSGHIVVFGLILDLYTALEA